MLESLAARIKVGLMLALFLSPVVVSAWSVQLDAWIHSNHTFEASAQPTDVNPSHL